MAVFLTHYVTIEKESPCSSYQFELDLTGYYRFDLEE